MAHGVRVADAVRMKRRSLAGIMVATTLVAMLVTTVVLFFYCYRDGGINLNRWFFVGGGCNRSAMFAHETITNPVTWDDDSIGLMWGSMAGGGAVAAVLSMMRARLAWWPLHPIGLPFQIPGWTAVMIAWIVKTMILKYGGVRTFRKLKPIFFGFILGQFLSAGGWFVIDMLTGMVGNVLYNR
jgi:hypothetical protein